jgi:protease-4
MRVLLALIYNGFLAVKGLLALPLRLIRRRRRPQFVRYSLLGDPPYLDPRRRRRLFRRKGSPSEVRSLEALRAQFKQLIADPEVRGVVVEIERLRASAAKREAVADLFRQMRSAGKLVIGYAVHLSNGGYELLCSADRIVLFSAGRLELTGFMAEATALGLALRRAGIAAHFVRRGQYKTAPELFTLPAVSEVQRETLERVLDDRFAVLVSAIARGRRLTEAQARAKVDRGPYTAKRALTEGLCDALLSEEELPGYLRSLTSSANGSSPREPIIAPFSAYVRSKPFVGLSWKPIKRQPSVAWVPLQGLIISGEVSSPVGLGLAGSKTIGKALKAAAEDHRCQAIVLEVASPGGSALASELILDQVRRAAQKKAVVVYTDQVAASGGYLAALGAKEIWAAPHAIVGSIGVFAGKFDFSELLERLGVHRTILTRGQNAGIFSSSRPFTEPEREVLEAEVEETYQDFLEKVAQARGKTIEEAHQRGEGRIFSGAEAMQLGLVDRTGGFEGACRRALELAGAPTPSYQVVSYAPTARRLSLLTALREISSSHLFALWDWWLEIGGERWLGKMRLFLLLACLGGLGACATAGRAKTQSNETGAIQTETSDQVLGQFLDAAERGDFDSAYQLLAGSWRARYTPARLKQDFELEPRAKEMVGRARSALKRGRREAEGFAEYPIGDGKAVRLVRENGAFKIASLE